MWLAMLPLHSRSMSGVVAHVLRKAEVCYCGWCLQRCELWIRLQWFMDPSQANYRPQLQSCLPGGSRLCFKSTFSWAWETLKRLVYGFTEEKVFLWESM